MDTVLLAGMEGSENWRASRYFASHIIPIKGKFIYSTWSRMQKVRAASRKKAAWFFKVSRKEREAEETKNRNSAPAAAAPAEVVNWSEAICGNRKAKFKMPNRITATQRAGRDLICLTRKESTKISVSKKGRHKNTPYQGMDGNSL